ncbi:aquaporin 12 [Chanos chanos]|uniref:Aquaporin n=1 Tax=Chanos chanos TaxID=29144 RepID=A0A6J2VIR3_CHACN|nr:aquaporin-12-like [Chanos chanos]
MSGLNISLGYFISMVLLCVATRILFTRWWRRWDFLAEFFAAFAIAACRLEVQTIAEVGQWASGLGRDVTLTMLFVALVVHGSILERFTGNPSVTLMRFLQRDAGVLSVILGVSGQLLGAHLALLLTELYWGMELTDMHLIKNLMASECTPSLKTTLLQGTFAEAVSALAFHLIDLGLQHRSQLLRVPLLALTLSFLAHVATEYTAGYANPSIAYALTFSCPGFSFSQYALVYWFGPLLGMTLALFLYMGHIPLLFSRNLLYTQKSRFRVPKGKSSGEKEKKTK